MQYLIEYICDNKTKQQIIEAIDGDEALDILFAKVGEVEILLVERFN